MSSESYTLFFTQLMNSKKYSDLKFACQGKEFEVHKAIVCPQSPVLAAACDGGFQVNPAGSLQFDLGYLLARGKQRLTSYTWTASMLGLLGGWSSSCIRRNMTMATTSTDQNPCWDPRLQKWVCSVKVIDMLTGWSDFSSSYLTELEKTRIDGETSSPSKSGNDGGDDDDDGSFTLTRSSHNLGTATQPTTNEIVLHHVHVNAIADYYDIPQLKQLVKTKIQNVLKTSWSAEGFSNVVKEVYSSTDLELQAVESQLHETESKLHETESKLHKTESKLKFAKAESSRIHDCLNLLDRTGSCRNGNCNAEFKCYIDGSYTLRCSRCKCRHYT